MIDAFVLRANTQTQSTLLSLPAEIRLKILRLLFRQDEPLRSRLHYEGKSFSRSTPHPEFEEQYLLSSQLLRCCQMLYSDGHPVLYGNNVLSIATALGDGYSHLGIFAASIEVENLQDKITTLQGGLLSVGKNDVFDLNDWPNMENFQSTIQLTRQFTHIQVEVASPSQKALMIVSRSLHSILHGKDITFILTHHGSPSGGGGITEVERLKDLLPLRYLRCRSFKLEGLLREDVDTTALVTTITSTAPVHDLYGLWPKLAKRLYSIALPDNNECWHRDVAPDFVDDEWQLIANLENACIVADLQKYRRRRARLVKAAQKWARKWGDRKRQELEDEIEKGEELVSNTAAGLLDIEPDVV